MKKYLIYTGVALVFLIVAFFSGRYIGKGIKNQQISNLIAARDSVKKSYIIIDGIKNSVAEKSAIILSQEDAIKAGIVREDVLKKLHIRDLVTSASLEGTIRILRDSLKLQPGTTIITIKDTSGISHDYVRIPFILLNIKDSTLSLMAGMNLNRTAYFDMLVPVSGTMTLGYKKTGFLGLRSTPVGIFTSKNPYLNINSMDILIVDNKKQKRWGIGIIGGYGFNLVGTIKAAPFVGAGVSYNFITF